MKKNTVPMNPSALLWGLLIELTFISRCSNFFIIQGTMIMLLIMIMIIILIKIFIKQQLCHHTKHVITMTLNAEPAMWMGFACACCFFVCDCPSFHLREILLENSEDWKRKCIMNVHQRQWDASVYKMHISWKRCTVF